ncbi:MAG TPA: hypothetical protein ENH28_03180 [Euryarchaeota archaeon]|nr:hypothetical protein BMS3Bbin15_01092 [archaeon BMS3Bbin15]HDL15145.1 hypothetical protein [Euryarchaeota archaeon]
MKAILVFTLILVIITVSSNVYSKENITQISGMEPLVKNFIGMNHGGSKCAYCHAFLLPEKTYDEIFLHGCRCHQPDVATGFYDVHMSKVIKLHSSKICELCHAGTTNVTYQIYHLKVHKGIPCTRCHTIQKDTYLTVTKPKNMVCRNCHKGNIHYIHAAVLGQVCKMCHGTAFASRYTIKQLKEINLNASTINKTLYESGKAKKEVKKVGFITISKIFASIINAIF